MGRRGYKRAARVHGTQREQKGREGTWEAEGTGGSLSAFYCFAIGGAMKHRAGLGLAGQIAFGRDMGATKSLGSEEQAGQALEIAVACTHEVEENFKDPLRQFRFWDKV